MAFRKNCDFSNKESTDVVSTSLIHVCPITRRKFKNSVLERPEYFTSLEVIRSNNSHTIVVSAIPRGNLASVFCGGCSQIGSNFGDSEDSMADSTDMDEKFVMMEKTIEALKKFVVTKIFILLNL